MPSYRYLSALFGRLGSWSQRLLFRLRHGLPMSSLAEVRIKLDRARTNLEHIKPLLPGRDLPKAPADTVSGKMQPNGKTFDFFIAVHPPSTDFRLAVADIVHDLRTALDFLAYQLAVKTVGVATARRSRKLAFLIHEDKQRFKSTAGNVIPLIGEPAVAQMERLQKYEGLDERGPLLWILAELDNITKHRMVVVVDKELAHGEVTLNIDGYVTRKRITNPDRTPLKDGAKLFSVTVDSDIPPSKVDVNIQTTQAIVFADTDGLRDGRGVIPLLRQLVNATTSVVDDFSTVFFHSPPPA